ncbi:isochorismate synthase [Corynebacterium sp. 4HC-13]|uniref:isochorismate synthase n=1 Tax=Corynebacterium anserum TaxID=2684406 RepID=UPI00163A8146|nr:isochorismate synthase [Corynebacterium anserum]MBC2681826.1 isochorismate synthase [Corynebacterium anserum]
MNSEQRPVTAPDFLLSRSTGSIRTQGWKATFPDPFEAATALRDGEAELIVGAIPFDTAHNAALMEPETVTWSRSPLEPPAYFRGPSASSSLKVVDVRPLITAADHQTVVEAAIATIQQTHVRKVVLARAVDVEFAEAPDPLLIAARLIDLSANRDGFAVDLTVSGSDATSGAFFTGSSPELLVSRRGSTVSAFPLAGSAPRTGSASVNEATAQALSNSAKDHIEHRYVVEHYRRILEPLCSRLTIPDSPEIHETNEMIHLGTHIEGVLKDAEFSALDLALMLHPTPAVGGTPTDDALGIINECELDRSFYAGAVGWCNSEGDGEYMVAIRSCVIRDTVARAWAGGGIIATSDAEDEAQETTAKLQTALRALNVPAALRVV